MTHKILIIDPHPQSLKTLVDLFTQAGYDVMAASDPDLGLKMALNHSLDAIFIDLLLPKTSGLNVLKSIRSQSNIPIIILSDQEETLSRRLAFKMGADDYIEKPCDPQELLERLHAILRRSNSPAITPQRPTIKYDEIVVDCAKRSVFLNDQQLELTNTEFNILEILIRSKGQAFSKEELTEYALGRKFTAYDRSIDVHISNLRNKLGNNTNDEPWVKTVRGFGYMFNE